METVAARAWILLLLVVIGRSAPGPALGPGSSPGPAPAVVTSLVGTEAMLPCSWLPRLPRPQTRPHVQWCSESSGPVLEQRGSERWTSPDLSDRAEVPESRLQNGDCSLVIRDVQVTDGGQYHGYMILDQDQSRDNTGTGIFIGSVKLLVFDHSSVQSRRAGQELLLDLFTSRSWTLVFQGSNSSEWKILWQRDGPGSSRVQKVPLKEQLSLSSVSESDQGFYKVLDPNGLTVSSTRLSVDPPHEAGVLKVTAEDHTRGRGVTLSPPTLLLLLNALIALCSS
ncbi:uncharacterized protein [Eucyclogobius newberryi]|uniref:uncharacterized protein n=1 Tax=Eucyclogobius newberryi TaxID=166745 RepID=UPI003B59C964